MICTKEVGCLRKNSGFKTPANKKREGRKEKVKEKVKIQEEKRK